MRSAKGGKNIVLFLPYFMSTRILEKWSDFIGPMKALASPSQQLATNQEVQESSHPMEWTWTSERQEMGRSQQIKSLSFLFQADCSEALWFSQPLPDIMHEWPTGRVSCEAVDSSEICPFEFACPLSPTLCPLFFTFATLPLNKVLACKLCLEFWFLRNPPRHSIMTGVGLGLDSQHNDKAQL